MSIRIAVLDDYQDVALQMTDWSVLPSEVQVQVFRDHLADPQEVAQRLRGFEIVMAMRERTPVRDHRVATRGSRRSYWAWHSSRVFSSRPGRIAPL